MYSACVGVGMVFMFRFGRRDCEVRVLETIDYKGTEGFGKSEVDALVERIEKGESSQMIKRLGQDRESVESI